MAKRKKKVLLDRLVEPVRVYGQRCVLQRQLAGRITRKLLDKCKAWGLMASA